MTTGFTCSLAIIYLVQCIRLTFMPKDQRNKLTMTIWWSILLNLVALEIKNIVMICLNISEDSISELLSYSLNSIACFFFTNAIMLQTFEWDLLGSMIIHQKKYKVSELNVVKDEFNKDEDRKVRWTRYAVWVNVAYHLVKVAIPTSTLITCIHLGVD